MPAFWLKWWGFWMTCSSAAAAGCWLWLLRRILTSDFSPAPLLRAATARLLDIQALAAACAKGGSCLQRLVYSLVAGWCCLS